MMMTTENSVCPDCGAIREQDASNCELCGHSFDPTPSSSASPAVEAIPECRRCGHHNSDDARYCNRCGERLTLKPQSLEEDAEIGTKDRSMEKQVGMLIGTSLILLIGMLVVSIWSDKNFKPAPATDSSANSVTASSSITAGGVTLGALSPIEQSSHDSLSTLIEGSDDQNQRLAWMKESVENMVQISRYDYAGVAQEQIARELKSSDSWGTAGTYFLTWMDRQPGGDERTSWARRAVTAFQAALDIDPNDLDIRTDMAFAYLNDPENPMEAIQQTNRVLESDSLHPQANFNRGLMLAQINRLDQAKIQFGKILRITEPGSLIHDRSKEILSELEAR